MVGRPPNPALRAQARAGTVGWRNLILCSDQSVLGGGLLLQQRPLQGLALGPQLPLPELPLAIADGKAIAGPQAQHPPQVVLFFLT
jgi:hypothetical protein